jgi:phosphopantothenoylcysteine decarboxylase/phosphopantothenate--cysteine ligase
MHAAVMQHLPGQHALVMAAAVADYTPEGGRQAQKVAKQDGPLTVTFGRTRDILADAGRQRAGAATPVLVGFAAETASVLERARAKLAAKQVDLIVANDVSRADAGFEVETNAAILVSRTGETALPLQAKTTLASRILDEVVRLLGQAS